MASRKPGQSIQDYIDDISNYEPLPAAREIELAKRIRGGDADAFNELIKANLKFVITVAKQYQGRGLPLQDLISEGNYGLMKAAFRYDETRGFKFISYGVWWIRQAILQALSDHTRVVRLPLNRIGAIRRTGQAAQKIEQRQGRRATRGELAKELGMTETEVEAILNDFSPTLNLEDPVSTDNDRSLLEQLGDSKFDAPDAALLRKSLMIDLNRVLATLKPREAEIIKCYFGLDGSRRMSLGEIGERYQLTRERIRQIKEIALSRLRLKLRNETLRVYLG